MKENTFGPHLTLDLSGCNKQKLADYEFIFNFLLNLPDKIGMTRITQPYVFPYEGKVPEDKGITGIVIIAESHCSAHTFPEKDYVFIDVFSCKSFDYEATADYIINEFEAKVVEKNVVMRGRDFPI